MTMLNEIDSTQEALNFSLTFAVRRVLGEKSFSIRTSPLVYDPENYLPRRGFMLYPAGGSPKKLKTILCPEAKQDPNSSVDEDKIFEDLVNDLANEIVNYYQYPLEL
jgi:hypothetical protein